MKFASVGACFVMLVGCGGAVNSAEHDQPPSAQGASDTSPVTDPSNVDAPKGPGARPAPACKPEPGAASHLASCDVAQRFMVVEPIGVAWTRGSPWQKDAIGVLHIRYRNDSPTGAISYPSVVLSTSDNRVEGESGTHLAQDGHFHPDRYALASCDRQEVGHVFVVHETLPAGTRVRFMITPAVADGNGISTCNDTLAVATFDVDVP